MIRTLRTPSSLRSQSLLLLLAVPALILEILIVVDAPVWNPPVEILEIWLLASLLIVLPIAWWISRGVQLSWYLLASLAFLWFLASVGIAVRLMNLKLAVFSIFLASGILILLAKIRSELVRSYFDPGMRWYESVPRVIPGLRCLLRDGDLKLECKVSRFDRKGAFLVIDESAESNTADFSILARGVPQVNVTFMCGEEGETGCKGRPVRILQSGKGIGIEFLYESLQNRKHLGDFYENLRGKGYA